VIAVVVVVAVILTQGSSEPDASGGAAGAGGQSELPVPSQGAPKLAQVETNGSYDELVEAGHAYYDSGDALKASGRDDEAVGWFAAAAKVYAAAWKLKPGDPALGTDYATAIFYSATTPERIRAAIDQVDTVIASDPDFQMARFNKGIYVSELAQRYAESGRTAEAERLFAQARAEYEAAVAIDSASPTGQAAAAALQEL
jgi:tetratricopeptide (TPR) repeat protein